MTNAMKLQFKFVAFSIWKRKFSLLLPSIYYFKKKGVNKIICATILRQINLQGRNLSHQIFSSTYLLACYLSVGLYNFYSRSRFCKVYLYYFVAPLILFLYFLLSYFSLCKCFSVQVLYYARFSPCKFKTKTYFFVLCLTKIV